MITLFTYFFVFSIVSLFLALFFTRKIGTKKYVCPLRLSIISALIITFAHIFIINTKSEKVAYICYTIFFIFIDILIFSVFVFSKKYTKFENRFQWLDKFIIGFGLLDCASSFLNIFIHHSFELKKVSVPAFWHDSAQEILKISMKWPYQAHLVFCYLVLTLLLAVIITRIVTTPKMYRFMYTNILVSVSVNIFGDYFYVFLGSPIDFSIIFTAVSVLLLCAFAIYFTPARLLQTQLLTVVSNMSDSVVLFDIDGELVYKNSAMHFLENEFSSAEFSLENMQKEFSLGSNFENLKNISKSCLDKEIKKNGKNFTFHISLRTLKDENKNFLGAFFIIHDKTLEVQKLEQERYFAIHDKLTNLFNRDGFYEKIQEILKNAPNEKYLMICSDIDNFKFINDLFGRSTGDKFLVKIADAIKKYSRPEQIFARLESDRFALFTKKSNFDEKIFLENTGEFASVSSNLNYPVNFHFGVYEIEDISMPVSLMCDRAFMALKTIKGNLQSKIVYYNSDIRNVIIHEQKLIGEFPSALANNQFQMYLQPQVKNDGNVYGAEALVRWNHPNNSIMRPDDFVPIFESKGLITNLDQFIWNCAAQKLKEWKNNGIEDMYISVNISPKDFLYIDVYKTFVDLIKKYDISPKNLKLEITESAILMNLKAQLILINKLRAFGFQIEMDDFGSGYSSLNMLKDIPFDVLKIDMAFLQATKNQERSIQILHSIIKLSKRLNMPVITEGVETKEQVDFLKDMGTDYYQGFYFARPMPVKDFESKYIKKN